MKKTLTWVNVNDKIVHQKSALTSVFDTGFLYGKGIFTTLKVREGIPLFFELHLKRLQTNAKKLSISFSSDLQKAAHATITKNKLTDGGIRITITPGTILIHAFTTDNKIHKAPVITTPDTRDIYKTIKTTYRVPHILAQKQALTQGAQDALFIQKNRLIESTYANIFAFTSQETVITPPIKNKGLNGISRQILMKNLPIQEKEILTDTTYPIVLVSSLSLRIVESINGKKIKQNPEFVALIQQTLETAEKSYIEQANQ